MDIIIGQAPWQYILSPSGTPLPTGAESMAFPDLASARQCLLRLFHAPAAKVQVQRLFHSLCGRTPRDEEEALRHLAGLLLSGRLRIARVTLRTHFASTQAPDEPDTTPVPLAAKSPGTPPVEDGGSPHWVEIRLLDEADRPVPGKRYLVRAPDGETIRGTLDGDGFAHVALQTAGVCEICFPDYDHEAWERA